MLSPIAELVWQRQYRHDDEPDLAATLDRVAAAIASVETEPARWRPHFRTLLADNRFLPGGRILANAGTPYQRTLCNCFVMGPIDDSLTGIFTALQESALTLQQGGGIGLDFSTLRPFGSPAQQSGRLASGPVSFLEVWDQMCATLLATQPRRGAMMGVLHAAHPDVERFLTAKATAGRLSHFNLSVLVPDALLHAVDEDAPWPLRFPCETGPSQRRLPARELWQGLMRAAYDSAEPGVLFLDRIQQQDNLGYGETIRAVNPCGEVPLPPYGACVLGSLNLTAFVRAAFTAQASLDLDALAEAASLTVRFLDNALSLTGFPLPAQRDAALASRRLGLGITGLADALILLGLDYGTREARTVADAAMARIKEAAYWSSVALAREKGTFPLLNRAAHLARPFLLRLPPELRAAIARDGLRNSHLLAIAPTGSISLLADNLSSGLEPLFGLSYERHIHNLVGEVIRLPLTAYSVRHWQRLHGDASLPSTAVTVAELSAEQQLAMQAVLQAHVDNAISKTVIVPRDLPFAEFESIYRRADALDLKGCTVFRQRPGAEAVLLPACGQRC